jgi:hypothetical protein
LQRGGEVVERIFDRAVAAGGAVDALKLAQDIRDLVGIAAAGSLGAKLALHEQVELAVDAGDRDRRAGGAARDLDLVRALVDIAGRLRVGDIRRDDRQRRLVGAQTRHRSGQG